MKGAAGSCAAQHTSASSPSLPESGAAAVEKDGLLLRALATENRVAVREAAEAGDDVVMLACVVQGVVQEGPQRFRGPHHGGFEARHAQRLGTAVLGMLQRQVEEVLLNRRQPAIQAGLDP
jgi:hypothetical protein